MMNGFFPSMLWYFVGEGPDEVVDPAELLDLDLLAGDGVCG